MKILCILGRSGSSKSTIEAELEKIGYNRIISYTTREMRGNEQNGKEYYFINKDEFKGLIAKGILMESAEYNGNYYGAPKPIGGLNHVIVVERNGFLNIKKLYGTQAIGIFIDTPKDIIDERIHHRDDTSENDIKSRSTEDDKLFYGIENEVDIIINGEQPLEDSINKILEFVRQR